MEYRLPAFEDERILREYVEEHYAFERRTYQDRRGRVRIKRQMDH